MTLLFSPTTLGKLTLQNRMVMAPLTRSRAIGNVANALMASYYAARASTGLIITEGVSPSPNGLGYARIPGLYSAEQTRAWRPVTDAVHHGGGKIFAQFMHTGRVGHSANLPSGARVLAPSAIALSGDVWTDAQGMQPYTPPTAMTEEHIADAIEEYATAARNAMEAGFDGVELHGANGYLIDQFLSTASNQRTDRWGGTIENRARFAVEVARATIQAIGAERVGMRLSPYGAFNGMVPDAETDALYLHLATQLSALGLQYIHIVDHSSMGAPPVSDALKQKLRATFKGAYILSGGYDVARANADLAEQRGDLVAFGRPFISNPDLVRKLRDGIALTAPDPTTFYTPGEKGYTDY
ncbi:MAG: alkene reductase [Gammaproteobacteria bacterium]|nr:alkene reductase [Gammaproteobacteria bacterium]